MKNMSFYESALASKEPFPINFTGVDGDNLLFWLEEGTEYEHVRVELSMTDYWGNYTKDRKKNYHVENILANQVNVVVTSIDASRNLVTVSASEARKILRARERKEIEAKLDRGEEVVVTGRVVGLKGTGWGSHAVVRPLHMNILLMLPVAWFSTEFVSDIRNVCKLGMPVEVKVLSKKDFGYKKMAAYDFICSRKQLLPDPWEHLSGKIHVDDVVTVLVTGSRQKGKNPASPAVSNQTDLACIIEGLNVNGYVGVRSSLRLEPHHRYFAIVNSINIKRKRIRLIAYRHKDLDQSNE